MKNMFKNISTSTIPSQKVGLTVSTENIDFEIKILNTKGDLEILKQVYDDGSLDLDDENSYINKIWKQSEEQNRYFIVGLVDSKPAGFVAGYYTDICGGTYFLSELFVNKNFRKQGVGEFLVKKVIEFGTQKGYTITTTQTEHNNIPAQKLYAKIGFKPVKNEYTQHLTLQIKNDLVLSEGENSPLEGWQSQTDGVFPYLLDLIQQKAQNLSTDNFIKNITETVESPAVFITCGKAFSGKTYLSKILAKEIQAKRFSYDEIWLEIRQTVETENDPKLDFLNILEIIKERSLSALDQGKTVIIDTLFDTKEWRNEIRKYFKDKNYQVWTIYTKISDQIQQDRITENKISKERHQVEEKLLSESNQKFEEPENEENTFVYEFQTGKSDLTKITLQQARVEDLDLLYRISTLAMKSVSDIIDKDLVIDEQRRFAEYKQKFEPEKIQIIKYGDLLVGRLRVVYENDKIYLGGLQILPEFQNKGIGTNILQNLIQKSTKQNLPIELEVHKVNTKAIDFYKKLGFQNFEETEKKYKMRFMPQNLTIQIIISKIQELQKLNPDKPFIIAIDGRGGSGKSTLATKLAENLLNSILIEREKFMDFMKGMDTTSENWDAKNFEIDKNAFEAEISKNQDKSVIILEGLKTFEIDSDLKIWVEIEAKIRQERAKNRDVKDSVNPIGFAKFWQEYENYTEKYISEHKPDQKADLVVSTENGGCEVVGS